MAKNSEHIDVKPNDTGGHNLPPFLNPDVSLLILTWITFFALLAVLYKFAWKPILAALDKREEAIRRSVEEADRIKGEMETLHEKERQIIAEAESKSKDIINQSRKAAVEAAKIIEHKAREQGQILLENATREIKEEKEKAKADLREQSAQLAVDLAGQLIEENLDNKKNRRLINQYIKEI